MYEYKNDAGVKDISYADGILHVNDSTYAISNDAGIYYITDIAGKDSEVEEINTVGVNTALEDGDYMVYLCFKSSTNKTVDRMYIARVAEAR